MTPDSPRHGPYLFQNKIALSAIRILDTLLASWRIFSPRHPALSPPKRLLLSQIAHLGDLILTTALLPPLKKALPHVEIGLLIGSWAREIVAHHPLIQHIHLFDHWKLNRAPISWSEKWQRHRTTARASLRALRDCAYDTAIVCNYHYPNGIPLLYRAAIPQRLGYTSGGFGSLLTHPVEWIPRHVSSVHHAAFLAELFTPLDLSLLKPTLPPRPPLANTYPTPHLILHIGTGNPAKQWPLPSWRAVAKRLSLTPYTLLFTGHGPREASDIATVIQGLPNTINLCNLLSWGELMALLETSTLLISGDTAMGHAAAALNTPALHLYSGIHAAPEWHPLNPRAHFLTHSMPCAPCYRPRGCHAMHCLQHISPEQVYQTALLLI